jgi:hypothetical protein
LWNGRIGSWIDCARLRRLAERPAQIVILAAQAAGSLAISLELGESSLNNIGATLSEEQLAC